MFVSRRPKMWMIYLISGNYKNSLIICCASYLGSYPRSCAHRTNRYSFWLFIVSFAESKILDALKMIRIVNTCALLSIILLLSSGRTGANPNPIGKYILVRLRWSQKLIERNQFDCFRYRRTVCGDRRQRCLVDMCDNGIISKRHRHLASWK